MLLALSFPSCFPPSSLPFSRYFHSFHLLPPFIFLSVSLSSIHFSISHSLLSLFPVFLRFIHFSLLTSQSFSLVTYLPFSSLHSNNLLTTSFPSCLLPLTLSILHSTSLVPSFPIQNFTPLPFLSSIIFFLSPHNPFVLPLLFPIQPFNLSFFSLYSLHVFPWSLLNFPFLPSLFSSLSFSFI